MRRKLAARAAAVILALAAIPVSAVDFRDIATVTVDTWFDGTWMVTAEDVLLARVLPALTLEARVMREDRAGWHQHTFFLGPVVNFTDIMYGELVYGLGVASTQPVSAAISHTVDANLTFETSLAAASVGVRGNWFPASGYWYVLPSAGGTFHPSAALGLLGKLFATYDANGLLTASFWGETSYAFSRRFAVRAGATVSYGTAFGYSLLGGINLGITDRIQLRYAVRYLSDTVEYLDLPQAKTGIENALVLDVRF